LFKERIHKIERLRIAAHPAATPMRRAITSHFCLFKHSPGHLADKTPAYITIPSRIVVEDHIKEVYTSGFDHNQQHLESFDSA
jgi:hypothetical protein